MTSLEFSLENIFGEGEQGSGTIVYEPSNADISTLTITSSDDTVFSVTQDSQNKAYFTYEAGNEGTATLTAVCGNVSTATTVDVYSTIQSVDVNMENELVVGDTGEGSIDWIPHSLDASGMTITSSDDSVVSVTIDPNDPAVFTYEALSEGTATITAECDGQSTGIIVSVTNSSGELTALSFEMETILGLTEVGTSTLVYEPSNADISELTITSSDSSIISITQNTSNPAEFTFEANGVGMATLTAVCGEITAGLEVKVFSTVQSIDLNIPSNLTLGDTGNGNIYWVPESLSGTGMQVTSSDTSVLTVTLDPTDNGLFTYEAVGEGTSTVTAECDGQTVSYEVTVTSE